MRARVAIVTTLGLAAGLLAATAAGRPPTSRSSGSRCEASRRPAARAGTAEQLVSATATFRCGQPGRGHADEHRATAPVVDAGRQPLGHRRLRLRPRRPVH